MILPPVISKLVRLEYAIVDFSCFLAAIYLQNRKEVFLRQLRVQS